MNRPAQRIIIAILALLLVVPVGVIGLNSAFGPGDEEQQTETPSVTENPENRPTADPADQPPRPDLPRPEEPAGLTEQSSEGAQATLTYLLESYSYMMSSGDVSVWENSVDPKCQVCASFLDNAQLLAEQDGYLYEGAFAVNSTTFSGTGEPPATGEVVADFTQEASILVDDPNLQPHALDEVSGQLIAQIAWDGDRWRVTDMSIAPDSAAASDGGGSGSGGGSGGGGGGASDAGGEPVGG